MMSNWAPLFGVKSASQTKNNDDTLAEDSDMRVTLGIGERWFIEGTIFIETTGNADFQCDFTGPAADELIMHSHFADHVLITGDYSLLTASFEDVLAVNFTAGAKITDMLFTITLLVGASAGDVAFRWAQGNSHGDDTKLLTGSYMKANRIS